MHQGLCCYFWPCLSTGFLGRAATHSLVCYGGNLLEVCFLLGQLHLGQIILGPLPHHSEIHQRGYIEGIPLNAKMGGAWQTFYGDSRVCSHCTSPENSVQVGYDMETYAQVNQCIPDARQTGICK